MPSRLFSLMVGLWLVFMSHDVQAQVRVVTTLPTLAALASEVGGSLVLVEALLGPTEDPHFVDARPNYIVKLNRADLLVVNGLELEVGWLPTLQQGARNPKILTNAAGYLDASLAVSLLEVPTTRIDRSQGDIHPGGNPHFLFDPNACAQVALSIGARLATLDAKNAGVYQSNAQQTAARLRAFGLEQQKRFATLSKEKRRVVSYHKSMNYLYHWLGLEEVATLEPKPGVPPDPGHMAQVIKTMKAQGIRVIVQEVFYPSNASKTAVGMVSGQVVLLPGGADVAKKEDAVTHLRIVADQLYRALSAS